MIYLRQVHVLGNRVKYWQYPQTSHAQYVISYSGRLLCTVVF